MKREKIGLLLISLLLFFTGCNKSSLTVDSEYSELIRSKYNERFDRFSTTGTGISEVMGMKLTKDERLAMEFLYAFMPLNDIADYPARFHLQNIQQALRSRYEMPWGPSIKGDIFLHFVLPQRVNNENLDSFRIAYYDEIADRISNIDDIAGAALEINHWCHEKVSYQPSDSRTSAPMSTILSARGRCGEESTFTVAALRCAGIPARQVYTPRWAHSDDNHAWVEVWVDGSWKYMGACEPEPLLDRGWFTEPARRAMLIHTKTFGPYRGNEKTTYNKELFSEINNLPKYAVTRDISVKVLNEDGTPALSSLVEFQLYNYAEFYPIATVPVNESGIATFTTGLGDLIVWARDDNRFDFSKITVAETDTIELVISDSRTLSGQYDFDLFAPLAPTPLAGIPVELVDANRIRLNHEDSIRQSYISSWVSEPEVLKFAMDNDYPGDETVSLVKKSMGNYREIIHFLKMAKGTGGDIAIQLLKVLAEKDLRDTPGWILNDHLEGALMIDQSGIPVEIFNRYLLNPRIANEIVTPWRSEIGLLIPEKIESFRNDPGLIAGWIRENIELDEDDNYYNVPISPAGVIKTGMSDELSLKILYVAICRTAGLPSRLEPGTMKPQYYFNGRWNDSLVSDSSAAAEDGWLTLSFDKDDVTVPEYYMHFTLARFEEGRYNTLRYPYNRKVTDFSEPINLEPGKYMLVTGNRLDDTEILASLRFFEIRPGESHNINVKLRTEENEPVILGRVDPRLIRKFNNLSGTGEELTKNGIIIAWVNYGKEPTVHILNDLPLLKGEFDNLGTSLLLLSVNAGSGGSVSPDILATLPSNTVAAEDNNMELLAGIIPDRELKDVNLPYIIYLDNKGQLLFKSEGYRIGIGEQIIKRIK